MDGAIAIALFTTDDRDGMVDRSIQHSLAHKKITQRANENKKQMWMWISGGLNGKNCRDT